MGNGSHFSLYQTHQITGIELSTSMFNEAKKKSNGKIALLQMNGENLDFKNETFDYVVLSHVLAVADEPEKLLLECLRVLKPNGKLLILNHFTPNNILGRLDRLFNLFSGIFHLKSLFYIENFKTIHLFELEREIKLQPLSYFKILIYKKT